MVSCYGKQGGDGRTLLQIGQGVQKKGMTKKDYERASSAGSIERKNIHQGRRVHYRREEWKDPEKMVVEDLFDFLGGDQFYSLASLPKKSCLSGDERSNKARATTAAAVTLGLSG